MKKLTILVEIISTIGAFASILWLFLDPGPEPFAASLAALVVILGIGIRAQVQLSKIQDESLSERLLAIQEVMKVTTDIPRLTESQLLLKFKNDDEFLKSFTYRMLRIFGLRRELIPIMEPEIVSLIDEELEPLFDIEVGKYTLKEEKIKEFASVTIKLDKIVRRLEKELTKERRNRLNI